MQANIAKATPAPSFAFVETLYERQAVAIGGPDGNEDDSAAAASYNNGMYTPTEPAATSVIAGEVYSSLEVNSLTTESIDEAATTASASISAPSSNVLSPSSLSSTIASSSPSSTASNSATSSLASTLASSSKSASSSSASSKSTNSSSLASNNSGGVKFHLTYLIPLFAIVGLVLFCVIAGKIWGRIAYSRERAIRRNGRLERQLLKEQRREKKERAERIRQQWEQNGWGETMSPDASFEKQHPDQAYDSDFSEDELKGPLSAIGTHLAGVKQGRPLPPAARIEQGRYGGKVEANNWLEVKWRRNFGQPEQAAHEYMNPTVMDSPRSPFLRATLRGTWERVKLKITENIGWGYDGNTPNLSQRRQIIADASNNHLWTRVPLGTADALHTQGGLLYPPQLGENGLPFIPTPAQSRRYFFPLAARHREGSFSPPEMKAPPNTIKSLPASPSKTVLASVRDIFTGYRSRSSQSLADSAGRGKHERLHSEVDDQRHETLPGHVHTDGSRCSLTEPQYLPPAAALHSKYDQLDRYSLYDGPRESHGAADPIASTSSRYTASVQRKPTQLETSQIFRARTASARKRREEEEEGDRFTRRPTSIMRHKSKTSMPISRSSTVRFNDVGESSATIILLGYSPANYDQSDEEIEEQVSPTKRLSRAKTTMVKKTVEEKSIRMYKSMGDDSLASAYKRDENKIDRKRTQSRKQLSSGNTVRSYTDAVKFGDDDDGEIEEFAKMGNFPTVDSRILSKARKANGGVTSSDRAAKERIEPEEVVVMDLSRASLTRGSSSRSEMPGLTHASSAEEEELESERDVESEIDSALLTLIARSNTSKSYYRPFPDINTPKQGPNLDSPGLYSPSRKKTWREKNGKWERSAEDEMDYDEQFTPGKAFSSTASPSLLPTPPLFAVKQTSTSPTRLPPSLSIAVGSERPQHSSANNRGRANLFIRPPTLRDVTVRPISPAKGPTVLSPSVYSDEEQAHEEEPTTAPPTRSTLSVRSAQSAQSASSNGSSSTSPQRRLAMAKRTAGAARPPRHYQAKLGGGDDDDDQDQANSPLTNRLHTGKSFRTPAEKDRERQFAMDRVQSIVTKGHAKRQQSF